MDNQELAKKIYDIAGGADNVLDAANCMTRLRLRLSSTSEKLLADINATDGVLGINKTGEELQIILGPGKAAQVASEFRRLLDKERSMPKIGDGKALKESIAAKNSTPVKLFFRRISSIFLPLIPGFIACGLITGIVGAIVRAAPEAAAYPIIKLLSVAGNSVFWGMNLFVGYSAAKIFGGAPILGGVLAALMSHPSLSGITLFDMPLVSGRGGVIAVVLVAIFGAWLEKNVRRFVPTMLDLFLTPFLTVLIAGAAAIFVLQPVGGIISDMIGAGAQWAVKTGGAATGALLASLWLPAVMLGIHQAVTPIHADLIARHGVTILLPILAMAGAGQVGASALVYIRTKNRLLKRTIASALPVGIMGVGEPLIYGVTLPLGRPFIAACVGAGFGGAVVAHSAVGAAALGISGLPLAGATNDPAAYLLGVAVSYAAGFSAAWILGFDDPKEQEEPPENENA